MMAYDGWNLTVRLVIEFARRCGETQYAHVLTTEARGNLGSLV
jgi:hypothetical protein